jgi:hypothetical protein
MMKNEEGPNWKNVIVVTCQRRRERDGHNAEIEPIVLPVKII